MQKVKLIIFRIFKFILNFIFYSFVASIFLVLFYRFVPPPITPTMVLWSIGPKPGGKPYKLQKDYVSINNISPDVALAVVSSEDNYFLLHHGFDFVSIKAAKEYNKTHTDSKKGASTISQQVAKNVFLWQGRSYVRKAFEVYFTVLIETFWPKKRIMELYLNEIEFGEGIYGVEAASHVFFSRPAKSITREQAALLAAVIPAPHHWSPVNPNGTVIMRQQSILWNMNNIVKIDYDHPPVIPPEMLEPVLNPNTAK